MYKMLSYSVIALVAMAMVENAAAQSPIIIAASDTNVVLERDTLAEVVAVSPAAKRRMANTIIGAEKIEIKELAKMPVLFGERDLMKSIQLLPGVKSESDGSSGYQVRGGTSAQNLVLLDNAIIYNSGHLMGLFSTFNEEALTNATLYKGQIPAQIGGAVSSVFDISTKSGDMQKWHWGVGIGLLSAKANVEGPLVRDKASFLVTARRSYLDLFLKATEDYKDTKLNFFDVNAKVSIRLKNNDDLAISYFQGRDNLGLKDIMSLKWGNQALSMRWFHVANDRLFSTTSAQLTNYKSSVTMTMLSTDYEMSGFVRHIGVQEMLTFLPNESHSMKLGAQSQIVVLRSAEWKINTLHEKEQRRAWQNDFWLNDDWRLGESFDISLGIRMNLFSALGGSPYYNIDADGNIADTLHYANGSIVHTYVTPEPRFSVKYKFGIHSSIKFGYSRTSQHIQAIRNSTSSSMPFDRYTMSSNIVKPQIANQFSAGFFKATSDEKYDFSLEAYYKNVDNMSDYKDGKTFYSEIEIERLLLTGKSRSYGLEFCAHKNAGRFTGWAAYTLAWSENKIDGIDGGRWYWASNDRRHDISIVAMYNLNNNWNFTAAWVYNTGQALTAPSAKYELAGQTYYYYAERNGYRAPSNHRLDVSATHTKIIAGRFERQLSLGIYNLYSRQNPYMIMFSDDEESNSGTKAEQVALFSIVPSISYVIKF